MNESDFMEVQVKVVEEGSTDDAAAEFYSALGESDDGHLPRQCNLMLSEQSVDLYGCRCFRPLQRQGQDNQARCHRVTSS